MRVSFIFISVAIILLNGVAVQTEFVYTTSATLCPDYASPSTACRESLLVHTTLVGGAVSGTSVVASVTQGTVVSANATSGQTVAARSNVGLRVRSTFAAVRYDLYGAFPMTPPWVRRSTVAYIAQSVCQSQNSGVGTTCCATPQAAQGAAWYAYSLTTNATAKQTCWSVLPSTPLWTMEAALVSLANRTMTLAVNITESFTVSTATGSALANLSLALDTFTLATAERVDLQSYYVCFGEDHSEALAIPKTAFFNGAGGLAQTAANFNTYFTCPTTTAAAQAIADAPDAMGPYRGNAVSTTAFSSALQCSVASNRSVQSEAAVNGASRFPPNALVLQCATHASVSTVTSIDTASGAFLVRQYALPRIVDGGLVTTATYGVQQIFIVVANDNDVGSEVAVGAASLKTNMCVQGNGSIITTPTTVSLALASNYGVARAAFSAYASPYLGNVTCTVSVMQYGTVQTTRVFSFAPPPPPATPAPSVLSPATTKAPSSGSGTTSGTCDEAVGCTNLQCAVKYALATPPRTFYDSASKRCVAAASCATTQTLNVDTNTCEDLNGEGTPVPAAATPSPPSNGSSTTVGVQYVCVHGTPGNSSSACVCENGYTTDTQRDALSANGRTVIVLCNSTAVVTAAQSSSTSDVWETFIIGLWPWGLLFLVVIVACCCCCCVRKVKKCCLRKRRHESRRGDDSDTDDDDEDDGGEGRRRRRGDRRSASPRRERRSRPGSPFSP